MTYTTAARPVAYKGTPFRSTLEARWAAIFDALDRANGNWLYTWQYEPQGFLLPSCGVEGCDKHPERAYLPDFYLPHLGLWVEVKGPASALDLTLMEWANHCLRGWRQGIVRAEVCQDGRGCEGLLLLGEPSQYHAPVVFRNQGVVCWDWERVSTVGFPYRPGGVLFGRVEKDHIYSPALPPDCPAVRFSSEDLLLGVDLAQFHEARRRAPRRTEMPDHFPEMVEQDVGFVPAAAGGNARRRLVRLPRPPAMYCCLDRADATGRMPDLAPSEVWDSQGTQHTPRRTSSAESKVTRAGEEVRPERGGLGDLLRRLDVARQAREYNPSGEHFGAIIGAKLTKSGNGIRILVKHEDGETIGSLNFNIIAVVKDLISGQSVTDQATGLQKTQVSDTAWKQWTTFCDRYRIDPLKTVEQIEQRRFAETGLLQTVERWKWSSDTFWWNVSMPLDDHSPVAT